MVSAGASTRPIPKRSNNHYIMKTSSHVKILSLLIILCSLCSAVRAAEYYVVIGSFAQESNARRFTGSVKNFFRDVSYSFNEEKRLYYVHVLRTNRKDEARNWSSYLRNEKGFKDAWVLTKSDTDPGSETSGTSDAHAPRYEVALKSGSTIADEASPSVATDGDASFATTAHATDNNADLNWTMAGGFGFINDVKDIRTFKSAQSVAAFNLFTFIVEDSRGKDRKSTRLNSSHVEISYAVFCLKKKKKKKLQYKNYNEK